MPTLTPVFCNDAPAPAASYSPAMKVNGMVYLSGQVALTPENKMIEGSIAEMAEQIFANMRNVLQSANSSFDKVVKVNVFLIDIKDFAEFNVVYAKYFNTHKPARSCVAVAALPLGASIEVECVAVEND